MKILFVCTGNTCRSPMAAAFMNKIASENDLEVEADSAGVFATEPEPASENAVAAMREYGIDLSEHRSKQLTNELINEADLILTMTQAHKMLIEQLAEGKLYTLLEYAGGSGDISDPYGGDEEEYKAAAQEIYDALCDAAERISDELHK